MSTMTPWWKALNLRPEIAKAGGNINDVQMSLFSAVHEQADTVYADVGYYSDITHPTKGLIELMGSIAVRMAAPTNSGAAKPVWRGDQGMGGGKSHALVGLFHMASQPEAFFGTILGKEALARAEKIAGEDIPADLGAPRVVTLPCDRMDPFHPDKKLDNVAETLGERWLWRLVDGDLNKFNDYSDQLGTPDGIKAAMQAVGRPVLTLVDEVLSYVRKTTVEESRAEQDQAFLRDLMDATTTSDHAALVIVMIASDDDQVAMGELGERIRDELEGLMYRYARTISTTSGGDFAEIIRCRLFTTPPPAEVVDSTVKAFRQHAVGGWADQFANFQWWTDGFADNVTRAYPFHPALVDLVEREWSNRAGFQRVRSTIQIFAAAVHVWLERAKAGEWAPPLIGPGDLPLSDTKVRESLLNSGVIPDQKNIANYREIAGNDVVDGADERGAARHIDVERSDGLLAQVNPRVAERLATALYLASLAPRTQGAIGATEAELRVAGYVPDPACDLAEIDAVLSTLESNDRGIATLDVKPGKGGQPRRLLMSTTQTLQMFFKTQRQSVLDGDIATVLRHVAQDEMSKGPFDSIRFVSTEGHVEPGIKGDELTNGLVAAIDAAGIDAPETRLVVLDPTQFTLLNGVDSETRVAVSVALGLNEPDGWDAQQLSWPTPMSMVYAASCVFALVNTQRRSHAVAAATDLVAWERVTQIANVAADTSLLEQAETQVRDKREAVRTFLRKAYQHLVYLGEDRTAATAKLEQDTQSALDGTLVWKVLDDRQKVFEKEQFDHGALLFQMQDRYWGKPVSTLRQDFYRSPRLPLLYDGDTDLKNALYHAQQAGTLVLINEAGQVTEADRPADINVTSSSLIVERPTVPSVPGDDPGGREPGDPPKGDGEGPQEPTQPPSPKGTPTSTPPGPQPAAEEQVVLSLMGSAFHDDTQRTSGYKLLSALAAAIDNADVSFGKFQIEVTVPPEIAEKLERAAEGLGVSVGRTRR
jgi:hypothetical protein